MKYIQLCVFKFSFKISYFDMYVSTYWKNLISILVTIFNRFYIMMKYHMEELYHEIDLIIQLKC